MRELVRYIFSPVPLLSWVLASAAATYTGPFGTYGMLSPLERAGYWFGVIGVSVVLSLAVVVWVRRLAPDLAFWPRATANALVFAIPYTTILWWLNGLVFADKTDRLPNWLELFGVVMFISVGLNLIVYLVRPEAIEEPPQEVRFFRRLRPELGQDLVRLAMQDHYLEVITDQGRDLILMRFSDAIDELEGYDGMRVHRSHWVARRGVVRLRREAHKLIIETIDGAEVPVSRALKKEVMAAFGAPEPARKGARRSA